MIGEREKGFIAQMKALFSEMTGTEASEIALEFSKGASQAVKELDSIMAYEGFSPRTIASKMYANYFAMKQLIARDQDKLEIISWVVKDAAGREIEGRYTNNEHLMKDIECICLAFVTRGSSYEKILKKSSKAMIDVLKK